MNEESVIPASRFLPIMAWGWPPGRIDLLREMSECGITVAGFVAPEHLDLVHEAGVKALVSDERASGYDFRQVDSAIAERNAESLAREIGDHPAALGVYVKDEPSAEEFGGLSVVCAAMRKAMPGKIPYVNLFPNYASADHLGVSDYSDYLGRFVEVVRPTLLSYDHYALMDSEPLRPGYYANLEAVRACALAWGLPFWNVVLSNAHYRYREPTAADIRLQAFTTLAYGGAGLSYYTYFTPPIGNFRMGAVDQFGHRTQTWSFIQNTNLQILNLAPTYVRLRSRCAYHLFPEAPPAEGRLFAEIAAATALVVGEFDDQDGIGYAILVNRDLERSTHYRVSPRDPKSEVLQVSPFSGELGPMTGENDWLAPGQGVLLRCGASC